MFVSMPVTHIDYFIMSIERKEFSTETYWQCPSRFHATVFSLKFRDMAKEVFTSKQKLYEEMIEGFNKEMDDMIRNNPHVLARKNYHNK